MKRFSSYGPPNPETEFMVQRPALVQQVMDQLVGDPKKGGHYFTIFAPRQVGKTTTLRQVVARLRETLGDSFQVGMATMHNVHDFRQAIPRIFKLAFGMDVNEPEHWEAVQALFSHTGPLKKPTLLILDEFDGLPGPALAETVAMFRQLYLEREGTRLHGLALIGVHAVLGELTSTMSPFNVQRSVNIPSLTHDEVIELYQQYQDESGQAIAPEGVERIYDMFRGQPGLTCWFGELLTEKHNPCQPPPWQRKEGPPPEGYPLITRAHVDHVLTRALYSEININIRNLISKGLQHQALLRELFVSHHMRFELNNPDVQWLYLNGILVADETQGNLEEPVCAFASPFVQRCLFSAFGGALNTAYGKAQLIVDADAVALEGAFSGLDVPLMLKLYRQFLAAQTAKGEAPWREQPSRSDARAFEAIGHFNLYAWLYGVSRGLFAVVPEFPTGNGTADLWLVNPRQGRQEVLEVKSFTTTAELSASLDQVKRYARKLKLPRAYLVVLADASAYAYLSQQPKRYDETGLEIALEIIPWGFVPDSRQPEGPDTALPRQTPAGAVLGGGSASAPPRSSDLASASTPLPIQERLALETLVGPLLTAELLERVWRRCGYDLPPRRIKGVLNAWDALVTRSITEGKVKDLAVVLAYTFPTLESHPLLMKLGASG